MFDRIQSVWLHHRGRHIYNQIVGSLKKLKEQLHISELTVIFGITANVVVRMWSVWYRRRVTSEALLASR